MTNLIAAVEPLGNLLRGIGPLGLEGKTSEEGPAIFQTIISNVIGVVTVIAIIWFVFLVITGAIAIITSGGDKQAIEGAQKKITSGLIGLVILIVALFIIGIVGTLIGIPDILDIAESINAIRIK